MPSLLRQMRLKTEDYSELSEQREFENKFVGVFAWVFPTGRAVNTRQKPCHLDKETVFQGTLRVNSGSEIRCLTGRRGFLTSPVPRV